MTKRAAFVTGASYGVGAATALRLAREGFDVAVSATRADNLTDLMAKLVKTGVGVFPVVLDLRSQASIASAVDEAMSAFEGLDLLVNNAGANLRKPALDVSPSEWEDLMAVNVTGPFFLSQQFGRRLVEAGRPGSIVNIASTHGLVGAAERSAYGISKAAIVQMTRMLAIEWADNGIRVNAVAPGRLDTASPSRAARTADPAYMGAMLKRIPLHRLATAEEVAGAVAYLASADAASITGQVLVLDGGLTAA